MSARGRVSRRIIAAVLVAALAAGCATVPAGPSVAVMPGSTKSFEQFQADDGTCRQWAESQAGNPSGTAAENTAIGAVIGTLIGAGLGAAIGAAAGNPGAGAAIGAGVGVLGGTASGANAGLLCGRHRPAALRHRLSAVHARQGQPDPGARARSGAWLPRHHRRLPRLHRHRPLRRRRFASRSGRAALARAIAHRHA